MRLERQWAAVRDGLKAATFGGMGEWCVRQAAVAMGPALAHAYIGRLREGAAPFHQVAEILGHILTAMKARIDSYKWMDDDTRRKAKIKVGWLAGWRQSELASTLQSRMWILIAANPHPHPERSPT